MKSTTLGLRYAKALLDLAIEGGKLEAVKNDIQLVGASIGESREFANLLESPIIKSDKKAAVLKEIFTGKISDLTLNFLLLLVNKRRESNIDVIYEQFNVLYNKHKGIETAIVVSAAGLDDTLRKKVYELVKSSVKSEVEIVEKIDATLIGGFILRVGDTQIDSSVVRSLKNLKRNFIESK